MDISPPEPARTRMDRAAFWRFCKRWEDRAQSKSQRFNIPLALTAYDIDRMFVDQKWRCLLSGVPFTTPKGRTKGEGQDPFGPSVDRIVPNLGYVPGNVRLVCLMVNIAMNNWGLPALMRLFDSIEQHRTHLRG